jgi:hypothetical protein
LKRRNAKISEQNALLQKNTLETLLEILDDLGVVQKELGKSSVASTIVMKLKNTMSDRHSAEKLFSAVLCDYRASVLPDIVAGWEMIYIRT